MTTSMTNVRLSPHRSLKNLVSSFQPVLFFSSTSAILYSAARPTSEIEAAESMNAVVELSYGRLVQPGGFYRLRRLF